MHYGPNIGVTMMISNLRTNDVRYMVGFDDPELTIPIVRTIKYICFKESDSGEPLLIFEEVSLDAKEKIFVRESDYEELVLSKEQLLDVLERAFDGTLGKPPVRD